MPIRFRLRWIPLCATLIVATAGIALGQWQTHRAQEKLAIQQKMAERELSPPLTVLTSLTTADADEFRQVKLRGEFVQGWTVYLENRPYQGGIGFYVLTPFKIAGSDQAIVVARGWAPRNAADRTRVPPAPVPVGEVQVEGILRSDAGHVLQLGRADALAPGAILQNLDVPAYAKASGLTLLPLVVEQTGRADDMLVRDWPAPSLGIDRHRGYAVQWYALAAMALVFFVVTGLRRGRNGKS